MKTIYYITSTAALNIPYQGIAPDWHQNNLINTRAMSINGVNFSGANFMGDYGLFDCREWLISNKIINPDKSTLRLCANPARVIMDTLYHFIIIKTTYPNYFAMDNYWFALTFEEKVDLSSYFSKLIEVANKEQTHLIHKWRSENEL